MFMLILFEIDLVCETRSSIFMRQSDNALGVCFSSIMNNGMC